MILSLAQTGDVARLLEDLPGVHEALQAIFSPL